MSESARGLETTCTLKEEEYCRYITFYINSMVNTHTHTQSPEQTHNIKQERTEGKTIKHRQIKITETLGQRNNGIPNHRKTKDRIAIGKAHISIITLNINRLNSPVKGHRVADWIKK